MLQDTLAYYQTPIGLRYASIYSIEKIMYYWKSGREKSGFQGIMKMKSTFYDRIDIIRWTVESIGKVTR